jgi:hypothetical protein
MALIGHPIVEIDGQNSPLPLFQSPRASPAIFENIITVIPSWNQMIWTSLISLFLVYSKVYM